MDDLISILFQDVNGLLLPYEFVARVIYYALHANQLNASDAEMAHQLLWVTSTKI